MMDLSEAPSAQAARKANSRRKEEHLHTALHKGVAFTEVTTGFENYRFIHQALPEVDLVDIDLSAPLFGKVLRAPLVISSMVGGIEAARRINRNLAEAAQALGVAMGIGSQRPAIDDVTVAQTYEVRDMAPDILLFANLGAVQLNYGYGVAECRRVMEMIDADALILHLNPLQEALQVNGNTNFAGLLKKIQMVCDALEIPVIVKEVGWGISEEVARKLVEIGVAGIDVAGAGGTSWSEVERHRAQTEKDNNIAVSFGSWGIPTAESIVRAKRAASGLALIASGGIRDGLDVAKAIALGADAAGIASPLLRAASVSAKAAKTALQEVIEQLRIAMFCIGAASLRELKDSPFLERK